MSLSAYRSLACRVPWGLLNTVRTPAASRVLCLSPEEAKLASEQQRGNRHTQPPASLPKSLLNAVPSGDLNLLELMHSLSLSQTSVSLPTALPPLPMSSPLPPLPASLPETDSQAHSTIVEPYDDLLPRVLPEHEATKDKTMLLINMIRLRRRKIKKMKKRKRLRKNRVLYQNITEERQAKRDKLFNAEQIGILREAESFDAETHVKEVLAAYNHQRVPRMWKGRFLFESAVVEQMFRAGYKDIPGFDQFSKGVKK